ncbi:MAG: hypothetical protein PHE52_01175 [Candidatus Pacebacteria bacterium]|nr:hypothetical protein [Candidatus Paceibacterota bacterium]
MEHKIKEKSKKELLEAIKRAKEKEHEARKIKHEIHKRRQQSINESD